MKRRKPILKNALRAITVGLAATLLALSGLWLFRLPIAETYTHKLLSENGVGVSSLEFEELTLSKTTLKNIALNHELGSARIPYLEIYYNLENLTKSRTVDRIQMLAAEIQIELPHSEQTDLDQGIPIPKDLLLSLPELLSQSSIPATLLELRNIALQAKTQFGEERLNVTLLREGRSTAVQIEGQFRETGDSFRIEVSKTDPDRIDSTATFESTSPATALDLYLPDWRNHLTDTRIRNLGKTVGTLSFGITSNGLDAQLELSVSSLELDYEEVTADLDNVSAVITSTDLNSAQIELQATSQRLQSEEFSLPAASDIALKIHANLDQQTVSFTTRAPLSWNYDNGTASGKAGLQLTADLSPETPSFKGSIDFESTQYSEYKFESFTAFFEGTPHFLEFKTPPLVFEDASHPVLSEGSGSVQIPDSVSEPIILNFESTLLPQALADLPPQLQIAAFNLQLKSEIGEFESIHKIALSPADADAPLLKQEQSSIDGSLTIDLAISEDIVAETYRPALSFNASNISVQSPILNSNGLAINGSLKLDEIPASSLDSPFNLSLLDTPLPKLDFYIEWQANEIVSENSVRAQWVGGSLKTESAPSSPLTVAHDLGIGILSFETLRFEQLYLEQLFEGDLPRLDGTSTLSTLFEGVPLTAQVKHELQNPLSNYKLTGRYQLEPARFTYSDILARLAPKLVGASVSASIAAKGEFHANENAADATITLSIEDASLDHPASQLSAAGIAGSLTLASLAQLNSGDALSSLTIESIDAGDLTAQNADIRFKLEGGNTLRLANATVQVFSGIASLKPISIPLDGSDFHSDLLLERVSLDDLSRYIDIFDGELSGRINGSLPFSVVDGVFQPRSGELQLDPTQAAHLSYNAKGLLTKEAETRAGQKKTFSDRLLKFLNIEPERIVEESLAQVTIERFDSQLFPPDDPQTPLIIKLIGTARTQDIEIPVVIDLRVNGTLTELYNFLIRLNSL